MSAQIFVYARKERLQEYLDLGWIAHGSLEGTHHGTYSILMEWIKDENPKLPEPRQ